MAKKHRSPHRAQSANTKLCHRTVKMYPVYARKTVDPEVVLGESPLTWVDKKTRDEWLDCRAVTSYSRGSMVRLTINLMPKPQVSVTTMGISDGVAAGMPYARSVLAAWTPRDRAGTIPRWARYGEGDEAAA